MKEKKLYTCEICHTDYTDKEKAMKCEKSHKSLEKATFIGHYRATDIILGGTPYKICVKFPGSNEWYNYERRT